MSEMVHATEYMSDFDFDSDRSSLPGSVSSTHKDQKVHIDVDRKPSTARGYKGHQSEVVAEYSREEWKRSRVEYLSMDAFDRHKKMVNDYIRYYGGTMKDFDRDTGSDKRDIDIVRENHRFLWNSSDEKSLTWEQRVAKKYWDKLYKEYCIADLTLYKENKIAMRWRIEKEVISGKGQFICGNKKCSTTDCLRSWEVNFGYVEEGEKKNALVKLRLCPPCSYKLNYRRQKTEVKRNKSMKESSALNGESDEGLKSSKQRKVETCSSHQDNKASDSGNVWAIPADLQVEKSVEEEVDEYLNDMFL